MEKIYSDSKVELTPFLSKHYDSLLNVASFGLYKKFIRDAIADMNLKGNEHILDFGCGTGRNACLMHQYLSEQGFITGIDLSEVMVKQFKENCKQYTNTEVRQHRIDVPFDFGKQYDVVFTGFVIHGFPHPVRKKIIQNAYNHLKPNGQFMILDFAEFSLKDMPFYYRIPFKTIECKYAFDFIERDWKNILTAYGFGNFEEHFYFKQYARLVKAQKK